MNQLAIAVAAIAAAGSAPVRADVSRDIADAETRFQQALIHADAQALQNLLADDFKVVHVNSRVQTKAQFIDALRSGRAKFISIEVDEKDVRDFGTTAVQIARWTNTIEFKGERSHGQDRITDVWSKGPPGWQLLSAHASFLEPPKKPAEDEQEVLALAKRLQDAWLAHDVKAAGEIVGDDFASWSFKGARRGKADLLKAVAQNGESSTKVDDAQVRVFGDTAIYTARITDAGTDKNGARFEAWTLVTSVFVRRNRKWQLVQDHESLLQK